VHDKLQQQKLQALLLTRAARSTEISAESGDVRKIGTRFHVETTDLRTKAGSKTMQLEQI
jgi:hypothetical protein